MATSNQQQNQQLQPFVPQWAYGMINEASQKYNIPATVIAAMIQQESGFNVNAVSPAGAIGIAQFMPGTAQGYGINPHNPAQAIDAMGHYLRNSMDALGGNLPLAIASYNAGLGNVQKYGGVPPFAETQNYVRNVMAISGQSGAQSQQIGTAASANNPQQVGMIPPTQVNNPASASPNPMMGRQAGVTPSQPFAMIGSQVPSALQQNYSGGQTKRPSIRSFGSVMPSVSGLPRGAYNPNSTAQQNAGLSQGNQTPPTSLSTIIANAQANTPTLPNPGQAITPQTTSNILPYLLGGNS